MRRTHLRGHRNILKRLLVHAAGANLGLWMRTLLGVGAPRGLQGHLGGAVAGLLELWHLVTDAVTADRPIAHPSMAVGSNVSVSLETRTCTTGC